jgi:hypothetical protein
MDRLSGKKPQHAQNQQQASECGHGLYPNYPKAEALRIKDE